MATRATNVAIAAASNGARRIGNDTGVALAESIAGGTGSTAFLATDAGNEPSGSRCRIGNDTGQIQEPFPAR